MAKSKKKKDNDNIVAVEEALSKSEQFIERHQNTIIYTVGIIVILIAGYIGYTRFILEPREQEALSEMFMAQSYFEQEEYEQALEGDAEYPGFLDIISDYRMTSASNLARFYAGVSLIRLGELEDGIDQLDSFRKRDQLLGAMAYGAIGDAYWEMGELEDAARAYRRAYNYKPNDLTTPLFLFKAGRLYEEMGDYEEALSRYEQIHREYSDSHEAREIEKYIARLQEKN
ncbi:MAG: tetratricopeptide repeat protein [Bacteroidales bacterium]